MLFCMTRESDIVTIIAENIRQVREKHSWSQEELADRCNLHRTYIGAIERGERNITVRTLCKITDALECDLNDLLRAKKS